MAPGTTPARARRDTGTGDRDGGMSAIRDAGDPVTPLRAVSAAARSGRAEGL